MQPRPAHLHRAIGAETVRPMRTVFLRNPADDTGLQFRTAFDDRFQRKYFLPRSPQPMPAAQMPTPTATGFINYAEYVGRTDPDQSGVVPKTFEHDQRPANGNKRSSGRGVAGKKYQLMRPDRIFGSGNWQNVGSPVTANGRHSSTPGRLRKPTARALFTRCRCFRDPPGWSAAKPPREAALDCPGVLFG